VFWMQKSHSPTVLVHVVVGPKPIRQLRRPQCWLGNIAVRKIRFRSTSQAEQVLLLLGQKGRRRNTVASQPETVPLELTDLFGCSRIREYPISFLIFPDCVPGSTCRSKCSCSLQVGLSLLL